MVVQAPRLSVLGGPAVYRRPALCYTMAAASGPAWRQARGAREKTVNENIDDLTIDYEENGIKLVKELDKVVLSRGAWTTIVFRYQEWKADAEAYGPEKYSIRRYRKVNGEYRYQSKFTISSEDQARKLIDALEGWMGRK